MTVFSSVLSQKCVDGQKGSVCSKNALRNIRHEKEETNGEDDVIVVVHTWSGSISVAYHPINRLNL